MASTARSLLLKGAGVSGAALLGVAYVQRLPPAKDDHRAAWTESLTTRLYRTFAKPIIVQTDAEFAHLLTLSIGETFQKLRLLVEPSQRGSLPLDWLLRPNLTEQEFTGPSLKQELFDGRLVFESPIGIAAGFDKNGLLVPLYRLGTIPRLGFAEVGSVSAQPAPGNARPRCWRIPSDEAVVNFMGLNNEGADAVAQRLQNFADLEVGSQSSQRAPIGVNIAKTHSPSICGEAAVQDFVQSFRTLAPFADFVVLNVSCPNTAEGKTFEEPDTLAELLKAIKGERDTMKWAGKVPPIFVKLVATPDSEEGRARQKTLLQSIEASGTVDGLVISNTVPQQQAQLSPEGRAAADAIGKGGLSGRPIHKRSVAAIRSAYEATGGRLPIIGVGGTDDAEAAYEKVKAGASLLEVYTGLVFKGPGLFFDIHSGLRRLLERDGFSSLEEAVGADVKQTR